MLSSAGIRLQAPVSPYRPGSPAGMSPRRGRTQAAFDDAHLRDLSPDTTLRAFTQRPMPFDVTRDEYKVFACVETLTPAERDLGARVARAAQRLRNWCDETDQWPWTGSFEQPSEEDKERRRRSLQLRIEEHIRDLPDTAAAADTLSPLEYWGSLLSVEVQAHEARLDEISDELIALDVEELKGHVLDMHPGSRSRPPSAGHDASRSYVPLDDFSFLITQTLISALPHHFQLKERLQTWTARVTVLREAPRYLDHLSSAQKAMHMGWEALRPPEDMSDAAFDTWKTTVDTISGAMQGRISDLGRRLDFMLDTLEGLEECLPDRWIDVFESLEGDFGRWSRDSRRRIIELDVWRHIEPGGEVIGKRNLGRVSHSDVAVAPKLDSGISTAERIQGGQRLDTAYKSLEMEGSATATQEIDAGKNASDDESDFDEGDTVIHNEIDHGDDGMQGVPSGITSASASGIFVISEDETHRATSRPQTPSRSRGGSIDSISSDASFSSSPPGPFSPSPSVRNVTNRASRAPRPALNAAMSKRRKNDTDSPIESTPWPPTQFSHQNPTTADELERKISDILTTIPAHIRLTSSNGADVRNRRTSQGLSNKGSKGYLRAARSVSGLKSPELTLSAVKQDANSANTFSGRKSAASARGDNDIRMYHLTQPGREQPIKLFIRRVGENGERVMVRVGGGWSDLGEYLRQYAEHHGRRTASNGQFEVLGLEVGAELSPKRAESAMSKRDRRVSGSTQATSAATTPSKTRPRTAMATNEALPPMPNLSPRPSSSNDTTTPSTGSSNRSWRGEEVGLAGPKSKKIELDNKKAEWVEGMMKQARSVSGNFIQASQFTPQLQQNARGESRSEIRNVSRSESRHSLKGQKSLEFADLGKVGGTKRVYMRGGVLHEH